MVEEAMHEPGRPILLVAGPTASGKSALALALAEEFRGTVINADSMQVYRDLRILTARPTEAETARVPHRLYGALDGAETCSAARWARMAEAEIAAAFDAGRLPIVAGGTGLYLRALLQGLAPLPEIPAEARRDARALHRRLGAEAFHALLRERDPESAARLNAADRQRLVRAYEVVTATGRPLGEWQRAAKRLSVRPALALLLMPSRDQSGEMIDRRFRGMVAAGAIEEVRALLARDLPPEVPILRAVGVPELGSHLRGELSLEAAIVAGQQASRRYAKRQMTWFRHQMPAAPSLRRHTVCAQFSESLLPEIFSFIRQNLLTAHP
jgi:tRNA dimethylallyltransferase